jgi:hypothetical protein
VDGDGDFIFNTAPLDSLGSEEKKGEDLLISVPSISSITVGGKEPISDVLKQLIPDQRDQIKLDDVVTGYLRRTIDALRLERFPVQDIPYNEAEVPKHIRQFEDVIAEVQTILILLARWAETSQLPLLEKVLARLAEADKGAGGTVGWLRLGWYPVLVLMYAGGIAALSAGKFGALRSILSCRVRGDERTGASDAPLVIRTVEAMTEIGDVFKTIPGHERQYAARSEYLFKILQPDLEDLLFWGERMSFSLTGSRSCWLSRLRMFARTSGVTGIYGVHPDALAGSTGVDSVRTRSRKSLPKQSRPETPGGRCRRDCLAVLSSGSSRLRRAIESSWGN